MEVYKLGNEKIVRESIENYGCKYVGDLVVKSKVTEDFVISIAYGVIDGKGEKMSILRVRIYNFNTMNEVFFDGNVYDTTYCEGVSFEDVIEKTKSLLNYQLKKLSSL
jgi:hypothetical protein